MGNGNKDQKPSGENGSSSTNTVWSSALSWKLRNIHLRKNFI